jgi:hypothetical protein
MNVRLDYRSGQTYSEFFSNFKVKVNLSSSGKRVHVSFRNNETGQVVPYASFSLPHKRARQLAYALLTASVGDSEPIEFVVEEEGTSARANAA